MSDLRKLAHFIRQLNQTRSEIAKLIGRPAQLGHVGEFIAAQLFDIALVDSAANKSLDGHFVKGSLQGHSVNIKWYAKNDGLLDITPAVLPDYYLVMTGPRTGAESSRGKVRPWLINAVFLFEAASLVAQLKQRGVKIGIATSVRQQQWREAEIFPNARNVAFQLTHDQRIMLELFGGEQEFPLT